jgi:uncharacterized membrane protein
VASMEFEVEIGAPPEKVFGYVSDLEKHVEWAHCQEIKKTSEGPIAVGSTYDSTGKNLGMTARETVEVTEYRPSERFAWRTSGAMGMQFNWSFDLQPRDGGTLLVERLDPPGGLMAAILGKLFADRTTRRVVPEGLAKIKERLEAGGS